MAHGLEQRGLAPLGFDDLLLELEEAPFDRCPRTILACPAPVGGPQDPADGDGRALGVDDREMHRLPALAVGPQRRADGAADVAGPAQRREEPGRELGAGAEEPGEGVAAEEEAPVEVREPGRSGLGEQCLPEVERRRSRLAGVLHRGTHKAEFCHRKGSLRSPTGQTNANAGNFSQSGAIPRRYARAASACPPTAPAPRIGR
jgi:hypothetical protein